MPKQPQTAHQRNLRTKALVKRRANSVVQYLMGVGALIVVLSIVLEVAEGIAPALFTVLLVAGGSIFVMSVICLTAKIVERVEQRGQDWRKYLH